MTTLDDLNLLAHTLYGPPWDESRCRVCGWPLAKSREYGCARDEGFDDCSQRPLPTRRADSTPPYSTDPAAARLLEDAVEREGLQGMYIVELSIILQFQPKLAWALRRATPEQITRAAIAAKGEGV